MTDPTPAQRLAAGHQAAGLTEHERRRLESIAAQHDPANLEKLRAAETRMKAAGQTLPPGMRTALGYAENAAAAAATLNQNNQ